MHKIKLCIVWKWIIAKNYFNLKRKTFVLRLFKMATNRVLQSWTSNFWWLRSESHVKFIETCVMCMEKHVLILKILYKQAEPGFAAMSLRWEDNLSRGKMLSCKEKVPGTPVSKEGHANSLLEHERTLEKGATVDHVYYCHFLWQNSPYLLKKTLLL